MGNKIEANSIFGKSNVREGGGKISVTETKFKKEEKRQRKTDKTD